MLSVWHARQSVDMMISFDLLTCRRRLRVSRRANSLLEAAGLLALIGVVSSGSVRYNSYREDKNAKEIEEARAVNGLIENS